MTQKSHCIPAFAEGTGKYLATIYMTSREAALINPSEEKGFTRLQPYTHGQIMVCATFFIFQINPQCPRTSPYALCSITRARAGAGPRSMHQ
jgi:hypothetical protein